MDTVFIFKHDVCKSEKFRLLWNEGQICFAEFNSKAVVQVFSKSVFILQKNGLA